MTKQTEAMKLALEALVKALPDMPVHTDWHFEAITALREALAEQPAQQQQEPVAWKLMPRKATDEMLKAMDECSTEGYDERLYAGHASSVYMAAWDSLPEVKHELNCVCGAIWEGDELVCTPHPPAQRTWVGLTDAEWMNIVNKDHAWFGQRPEDVAHEVAKLIEAKLKEKNT